MVPSVLSLKVPIKPSAALLLNVKIIGGTMKILIAYSSRTGNTEKLCTGVYEGIKDEYDVTLCNVKACKDYDSYDLLVLGYWVDRGTANKEARKVIESIRNKNVALLGTIGAAPDSEHGQKVYSRVPGLVDASNQFLGAFMTRGKIDPKLQSKIKFLPLPGSIRKQMEDACIGTHEPNETDITNAVNFVKGAIAKL